MDAIQALKNKLQALIADGETEQALEQLLSLYGKIEGDYHDELILLKSQLKELRDQQLAGIIGQDAAVVRSNMIKHSLLQIVLRLDEDPKVRRHFGAPVNEKNSRQGRKRGIPTWFWGALGGLVVALLLIGFLGPLLGPDKTGTSQPAESAAEKKEAASEEQTAHTPVPSPIEKQKKETPKENKQETNAAPAKEEQDKTPAEAVVEEKIETEPPAPPKTQPKVEKKAGSGEAEPNDEMKNAQAIGINQPVACYLGRSGDVDCFQVAIGQPGKYVVWMKNASSSLAGIIDVYNERQMRLGRYTNRTPGADHPASFRAQKTGMHYIRVSARGFGDYSLEVKPE